MGTSKMWKISRTIESTPAQTGSWLVNRCYIILGQRLEVLSQVVINWPETNSLFAGFTPDPISISLEYLSICQTSYMPHMPVIQSHIKHLIEHQWYEPRYLRHGSLVLTGVRKRQTVLVSQVPGCAQALWEPQGYRGTAEGEGISVDGTTYQEIKQFWAKWRRGWGWGQGLFSMARILGLRGSWKYPQAFLVH